MNSFKRVMKALSFEKTDRVPVVPLIIQHAIEISGTKHKDYSTNPHVMANTQLTALRYYGYDSVYVSTDNYVICEAMGGKVNFPDDDPPQLLQHSIPDGDLTKLKKFSLENGRIQVILEATKICRKELGDSAFVKTNIDSAPFSAAASVRGPEELMIDMYEKEETVHKLLEICTQAVIDYGIAASEAGAHGIAFGDSVSGLLSREMYQKFALPCAKTATSELKQRTGLPVFYHVCGSIEHISDLLVQTGADCIEIDSNVPMENMMPFAAGKCALEGNISTIAALLNGTPEDVTQEANHIISLFKNNGGLILSSACEIPRFSPRENVAAIVKAAEEYPY